jgi:hypothetical protein
MEGIRHGKPIIKACVSKKEDLFSSINPNLVG